MIPTVVDPAALQTELAQLRPLGSVDVPWAGAEYLKLSHRAFELLLFALFQHAQGIDKHGINHDDTQLLNEGADRGRDVVLYRAQKPVAIVQCKRYDSNLGLRDVLHEMVRFILCAKLSPWLLPDPDRFAYILAVARGVSGPAGDLFHEPKRVIQENAALVATCVAAVVSKYSEFAELDAGACTRHVLDILPRLSFKLLAREQLDLWLAETKEVFGKFFATRLVVDSQPVEEGLRRIGRQLDKLEEGRQEDQHLLAPWLQHASVEATFSVVAAAPGPRAAGPIVLADVYVPRTIESEVDEWLGRAQQGSEGVLVAIVAPGGFGKTSLLWNCHRRLKGVPQQAALLCPATQLASLVERGTFLKSMAALIAHACECAENGRRLVLCLDTFDVLVHREELLSAALSLVSGLLKAGASVILSSRPEELSQVHLESLASRAVRLYLHEYDDDEFANAVQTHCRAFYRGSKLSEADLKAQVHRLQNLVGLGRPVKEVCLNPLTLRMLFELYAPYEIPEDINSFRLYTEYWISRVVGDTRAGSLHATGGRSLSAAVEFLAAEMLLAGAPLLSELELRQHVARGSIKECDLAELVSRNLLVHSELGGIEFFHQTFFEYSAARYLERSTSDGLGGCISKLRELANDGVRYPVYEQLLLLYAHSSRTKVEALESGAGGLLREAHPALKGAALHVHMLSPRGLSCGRDFTVGAAAQGDHGGLKRFAQLIYNLPTARADEVVQLIEAGWAHSNQWKIVDLLSQLFVWLAQNRWDLCREQLKSKDLIATLYRTASGTVHVERIVVAVLRHGLATDPDWVLTEAFRCVRNHRHHPTVLAFIAQHAHLLGLAQVRYAAERIRARVVRAPKYHDGFDVDPASECLAACWARFPELGPTAPAQLQLVDAAPTKLDLRALARVKNPHFDRAKLEMLSRALSTTAPNELHLLLHEFLVPLMMASQEAPSTIDEEVNSCCEQLVRHSLSVSRDQSPAALAKGCSVVVGSFVKDLYVHEVAPERLSRMLLDVPGDQWLRSPGLVRIFAVALVTGSPHAREAFNTVCAAPEQYKEHVLVLSGALPNFPCNADRLKMGFELANSAQDAALVLYYLQKVEEGGSWGQLFDTVAEHASVLAALARSAVGSKKSKVRTHGYSLFALLARRGIVPAPDHAQVLEWAFGDTQLSCRMAALPLLVEATTSGTAERTIEVLLDIGDGSSPESVNRVADCLRVVLGWPGIRVSLALMERLLMFALKPEATEPQVSIVGRLIDLWCAAGDSAGAHRAALALLRSGRVRAFSATQKRTLGHHLDKPFQALYRVLSAEELEVDFEELRQLDPYFGRLVVVAICKSERADLPEVVNRLLADPAIHPDLLKIIQDYRQYLWKR